jgi:aquaporin Z
VALWAGGRFPASQLTSYAFAQVVGGIAAAAVLYLIASGQADGSLAGGFAANGYGRHSPGKSALLASLVTEAVMTFCVPDRQSGRGTQASSDWIR